MVFVVFVSVSLMLGVLLAVVAVVFVVPEPGLAVVAGLFVEMLAELEPVVLIELVQQIDLDHLTYLLGWH